jgi:hypothetical protein
MTGRRLAALAPFAAAIALVATGCGKNNSPGSTEPGATSGTTTTETHTGTTTTETHTGTTTTEG